MKHRGLRDVSLILIGLVVIWLTCQNVLDNGNVVLGKSEGRTPTHATPTHPPTKLQQHVSLQPSSGLVSDTRSPKYLQEQDKYIASFKKLISETNISLPRVVETEEELVNGVTRSRRLPSFVIIGMPKCGTGALQQMINAHSKLVSIDKTETFFFDKNFSDGWEWYLEQMPLTTKDQLPFEKSASYFRSATAFAGIRAMGAKVLVVVRDPFVRTVSSYAMGVAKGAVKRTFEELALDEEGEVRTPGIATESRFYEKLKPWIDLYPKSQLHIVDGDRLVTEPWEEMEKVQDFLGVEREITRDSFWLNETKGFYCLKTSAPLVGTGGIEGRCQLDNKGRPHAPVAKEVEEKLRSYFRPGNEMFFELVGRTFDWR